MLLVCLVTVVINAGGVAKLMELRMEGLLVRTPPDSHFFIVDFSKDVRNHPEVLGKEEDFKEVIINEHNCVKAKK